MSGSVLAFDPGNRRLSVRLRFVAVGLACVMAASGCGPGGRGEKNRPALVESENAFTGGGDRLALPGLPIFLGFWSFDVRGKKPLRLRRGEVLGIPDGLVIDNVWAIRKSESRTVYPTKTPRCQKGGGTIGGDRGHETKECLRPVLHELDEVTLDPTKRFCPPIRGTNVPCRWDWEDWYFLIESHITRPGSYRTNGLRIVYEVDGERMQTRFRFRLRISSDPKLVGDGAGQVQPSVGS